MEFLEYILSDHYLVVTLLCLVVLLIAVTLLAVSNGKRTFIKRKLNLDAIDIIENAKLKDAVGDELIIDFLLIQPEKMIAVTVLPYEGNIFGAEKIDQWTQVIRSGSFKFTNPYQNFAMQKNAVDSMFHIANIECKVFFPNATFPKDKPDSVWVMDDLPAKKQYKLVEMKAHSDELRADWKELKKISKIKA